MATRGPGRPPTFSGEQFVAAAIEAIEERGVANLTMREIAVRLGAAPSAAYRHVADKEQLMLMVVDEILGKIEVPETGTWHERLIELHLRTRTILKRYPGVGEYIIHVSPRESEQSQRLLGAINGMLAEGGLDDDGAYRATILIYKLLAGDLVVGVRSQLTEQADTELFVFGVDALLSGFGLDLS